ncbi:MAG: hypothetical protein JNM93_12845 [Bacteriovoracaceae bacterium]|nr:hypothetical protein [Bacteriovoracaceae bacterium]
MRYLSFDIEATGLNEHDLIIEFACVPFDTKLGIEKSLAFHYFIQCPAFEILKPRLDPWVIQHNEKLIRKANETGLTIPAFQKKIKEYLESEAITTYFNKEKVVLFGKSMNSIDLPFLNRDLGWDFMRKYFHHRMLDLTCFAKGLVDLGKLPKDGDSGSVLMKHFGMGAVAHTALEDAVNTAELYLKILNTVK